MSRNNDEVSEIIEIRVEVPNLKLGMYVSGLDRDWLETDFPLQGFPVREPADIQRVAQFCKWVVVDDARSIYVGKRARPNFGSMKTLSDPIALKLLDDLGYKTMRPPGRVSPRPVEYPPGIELAKELPRAIEAWKQAKVILQQIIAKAKAGKTFAVELLDTVVEPLVESAVRGADAALWLATLRRQSNYPLHHPLNCCALTLAICRYLGFPPELLIPMAKGALVMDVGMWRLPKNYYIEHEVSEASHLEHIHSHVLCGLEYLEACGMVDQDVKLMVMHHHERYDSEGYPRAVRGPRISLMGQILALADTYDAVCSRRTHKSASTPAQAQSVMYQERDLKFSHAAADTFLASLGVYPTGTPVLLSNGAQAVVSGQVRREKLLPKLVVVTDEDGQPLESCTEVCSKELLQEDPPIRIVRTLRPQEVVVPLESVQPKEAL